MVRLRLHLPSVQVRTLFVSGLPMDVRLRELYLLFRSYQVWSTSPDTLSATGLTVCTVPAHGLWMVMAGQSTHLVYCTSLGS